MKYLTIKETALRWGVSDRTVNSLCLKGRIKGATKIGTVWAIPDNAEKPDDPRRERKKLNADMPVDMIYAEQNISMQRVAMPLMNTPFRLGHCMEDIEKTEDEILRNIALAEYYYFSGQSEKVTEIVEPYINHKDIAIRVSACWLYIYSNLVLDKPGISRQALENINELVASVDENTDIYDRAYIACVSTGASALLHLPMPKILTPLKTYIHMMPPGLRLFILYIEAHHSYLNKQYGTAIGIAETALALEGVLYPIPTIYLHLIACVAYLNLKHPEMAKEHFMEAWKIAQPDDIIQPIAEHHGLMGGTLEATIKRLFPNDFKRIITQTYKFSSGWRKIHNSITGHSVADNLTTTEFAAAMLAARGWTNQEISSHMGVSEYTVRHHISTVFQKLHITQRKELQNFLLR